MKRASTAAARRGRLFTNLTLLTGLALGCGDDPTENLATVRPMTPPAEPAYALPELDAVEEDDPTPAVPVVSNQPPQIRGMQVDPAPNIPPGAPVRVVVNAFDPEGDEIEIEYRWFVNGDRMDEDGDVLSSAGLKRGDRVRVEAVASDGRSDSPPMASPVLRVDNGLPTIVSRPEAPGPNGRFVYQVAVEDPEGDTNLRFELAKAPAGMTIHAVRGTVAWQPRRDQAGTHPVEIVVTDSAGGSYTQTFELTIGQPPASAAP